MNAALTTCSAVAVREARQPPLFDGVEKHFLHRGHGIEFDMEARWVRSHLSPEDKRIADVGCGIGGLFPWLGVGRTVGVDFHIEGLARTRRRFDSVPLVAAGARRLAFADESLDAVALQHVIEHLDDPLAAASEWYRVLRPGGKLLIVTPNRHFRDPSVFSDPTHVQVFDHAELAELVSGAGFEILDLRTLGLPWFRAHRHLPGVWRLRRIAIRHARRLSRVPGLRWRGQTLCCAARRPRG